jgi:betaine-aldehyde dehydrogenase
MLDKKPAKMPTEATLPSHRELYYGGAWHKAQSGRKIALTSPATGEDLGAVEDAGADDVERAIAAAATAFKTWRRTKPLERAEMLREIAHILRAHAEDLALVDAIDCGNPAREMVGDVRAAAGGMDFFAGLVTEMKGETVPMGPGQLSYSVREPLGVCAKIIPYNHPLMFAAVKAAAPLAAGNTIIVKPCEQAPLSALRFAELIEGILPPGVFNLLPGGRECGAALSGHPGIAKVSLIGSVPTGKAILRAAADTVKPVMLELGGKNALIVCADADPDKAAAGIVRGMNFTWAGQSCGSTSRVFIHESLHDEVLAKVVEKSRVHKPGIPTDMDCTMGSIVNQEQFDKVMRYIQWGKEDGARLVAGGKRPDDPKLARGFFVEPTIFADVKMSMRIAKEEIFGPVLSVLKWRDEAKMIEEVNAVEYGLTGAVFTRDLVTAHRLAAAIEAGYIWINQASTHFLGAPFGGYKQSGLGREECLAELLSYTQIKNVNVMLEG